MADCCPKPTTTTTVEDGVCTLNYREIWRIVPVREGEVIWDLVTPTSNVPATLTGLNPADVDGWDILKVAADDTKAVWFPKFGSEVTVTPGAELSSIGMSNTKNHIGYDPSDFVGFYEGLTAAQEGQMDKWSCEGAKLDVYFILYDKSIVGTIDDVDTPVKFSGIPIASAIALLGRAVRGFTENDRNELNFQLLHNWSHKAYRITPTFDTLTYK